MSALSKLLTKAKFLRGNQEKAKIGAKGDPIATPST